MKFIMCFLFFIAFHFCVCAQGFGLLRQDDDLRPLDSMANKSWYQNLKGIRLFEDTVLSIGGSWRFQAESFVNDAFDRTGDQDNIWYLNRLLTHAHLKVGDGFEFFTELGSSLAAGKDAISPVDKNGLYVNQLFAKYRLGPAWEIGAGRHNMRFGSGRLVDLREGPNVRRSFDFFDLHHQKDGFKAKLFFAVPVQPRPEVFDDVYLKFDETFSGAYTTTSFSNTAHLDSYILYQKENGATYNSGVENERRASTGFRHFGTYKGVTYNNEMVYQFGTFGDQAISAWTLSFHLEGEAKIAGKAVTLGLKTEAISGDKDPTDKRMNTFDALYPRGAYFGRVARFGPSNLIDFHPFINTTFNKWQLSFDYVAFWRYSLEDGVYGAAMNLEYPSVNGKRFIAHQAGAILGYQPNRFLSFALESNVVFPGGFLRSSDRGDTLYHFVFTSEIKF